MPGQTENDYMRYRPHVWKMFCFPACFCSTHKFFTVFKQRRVFVDLRPARGCRRGPLHAGGARPRARRARRLPAGKTQRFVEQKDGEQNRTCFCLEQTHGKQRTLPPVVLPLRRRPTGKTQRFVEQNYGKQNRMCFC